MPVKVKCKDLRAEVNRFAVERLLSESTLLRVVVDFVEEKGMSDELLSYLRRRDKRR